MESKVVERTWYWMRASNGARLVDDAGVERARIDGNDARVGERTLTVRRGRDRMVLVSGGKPVVAVETDWAGNGHTVGSGWATRRWRRDAGKVVMDRSISVRPDGRVQVDASMDPEESATLALLGWASLEGSGDRVFRSGPPRSVRTTLV